MRALNFACIRIGRAVELSELGICGRLQPNLLKSRRRDLDVPPKSPVARSFAQSGSSKPQMPSLALRLFCCAPRMRDGAFETGVSEHEHDPHEQAAEEGCTGGAAGRAA